MTPPPTAFRSPPAACLCVAALLLVASGCGGDGTGAAETTAGRSAAAKTNTAPEAASTSAARCPEQLGAFVGSLQALRRRLAVGLSYEQYLAQVKGLRASYGRIPVDRLGFDCLAIGTPSEKALNEHLDAANAWGECLADAACTTAAIEPVLQRKWRVAARFLSEAAPAS